MTDRLTPRGTDFLVCDMDQGVLRRERTRRAAVAWVIDHVGGGKVLARHRYGPGSYEYRVGVSQEDCSSWFIEMEESARHSGFAGIDRPLYPFVGKPHEADPDVEKELDLGKTRSWGSD